MVATAYKNDTINASTYNFTIMIFTSSLFVAVVNPLSPSIHIQIRQTDPQTFP